jgi:hypothetical protein
MRLEIALFKKLIENMDIKKRDNEDEILKKLFLQRGYLLQCATLLNFTYYDPYKKSINQELEKVPKENRMITLVNHMMISRNKMSEDDFCILIVAGFPILYTLIDEYLAEVNPVKVRNREDRGLGKFEVNEANTKAFRDKFKKK